MLEVMTVIFEPRYVSDAPMSLHSQEVPVLHSCIVDKRQAHYRRT